MTVIRLGSRGSALARWQAEHLKQRLEQTHAQLRVDIRTLRTTGDRVRDVPLAKIGDKGLFTKEIDRAVLDGEVDGAVHSLKDVPTQPIDGLALRTVFEREDPRDVLLAAPGAPARLGELPPGARVGTSSLRRRALLLSARPDLAVDDLRGNLDTRLARVADGDYDAAILAHAGVLRIQRADAVGQVLEPPGWLPAAGQGALAVAIRSGDGRTRRLLAPLEHGPTCEATTAERSFLRALEGGCQIPIGALAEREHGRLRLHGFVGSLDGATMLRGEAAGPAGDARAIGRGLADELVGRGADDVLREVRRNAGESLPDASAP